MSATVETPERAASRPRQPHATAEERAARGRAARAETPRSSHGDWEPPADRRTRSRSSPTRRRLGCPSSSRSATGGCSPRRSRSSAARRRSWPPTWPPRPRSGLTVQLCGDAHLSNFGVFASPERGWCSTSTTSTRRCRVRGSGTSSAWPRAWRSPGASGGSGRRTGRRIVRGGVRAYREAMREFAAMRDLRRVVRRPRRRRLRPVRRSVDSRSGASGSRRRSAKARTKDSTRALTKLTERRRRRAAHRRRPAADRPDRGALLPGAEGERSRRLADCSRDYRRALPPDRRRAARAATATCDLARKVVGVGSVGTRAWIALLLGPRRRGPAVPAGQGGGAVGARGALRRQRVRQPRPARGRGAAADAGRQRHLPGLAARDRASTGARDFYVRQLWDWKGSRGGRDGCAPDAWRSTASSAAGRWRARTPARATGSRSPPTSGRATASTGRSPIRRGLRRPERA